MAKATNDFGHGLIATTALTPTPEMIKEGVTELPIMRVPGIIISCWELTDADIDRIRKTKRLYVLVASDATHPPLGVATDIDFARKSEPVPLKS